uniref:Uncharacterized protein n=1 Tax=Arundo donax TaxID=35708 RepID=A0A0A9BZS6_ARUDO
MKHFHLKLIFDISRKKTKGISSQHGLCGRLIVE